MTLHEQTQLAVIVMVVVAFATVGLAVGYWLAGRNRRRP